MPDYNQTLQWLQQLLGNTQSMYGQQFNQGLSAQQQALADTLANRRQMQEADLALQRVIADWQNQLATRKQTSAEQAQQFGEEQTRLQESFPYQARQMLMADASSPQAQQASNNWLSTLLSRYDTQSPSYAFGIPAGGGATYNPYTRTAYDTLSSGILGLQLPFRQPAPPEIKK